MGVCVEKEKDPSVKPLKWGQERVITCTIDTGNEKYKQTVNSKNTVKELIHSIKKNYQKSPEENEYIINLYYNGVLLSKENEYLDSICKEDEMYIKMVLISITDSLRNNKEKIEEALISKLCNDCIAHKGDKAIQLCINCNVQFCDKCTINHKNHNIIHKKELIKYQNDLKSNKENIQKVFDNMGIDTNNKLSDDLICKSLREEMEISFEKINSLLQGMNRKKQILYKDFKNDFYDIFPMLMEYKEKVDLLYDSTKKESVLQDEKMFIDFYYKYKSVQDTSGRITDKIISMKNKIESFKDNLNELIAKSKIIYEYLIREINSPYVGDIYSKISNDINPKNEITNSKVSNNRFAIQAPRLNLRNLFSPPKDKKALIKSVEQQIKEKKNSSLSPTSSNLRNIQSNNKNNNNLIPVGKIEESSKEESIDTSKDKSGKINLYYNIEVGSKNLITYNASLKKISKFNLDLSNTAITRFEAYHSTLNFKGKFYISGGYSTAKMFYKYNSKENTFKKLKDMINGHSFHCLLGVNNFIFAIGGFKSKKVEKYTLNSNEWEALPDSEVSRSWPGCICVNDSFLLLFGGLCDKMERSDKIIEKYNFKEMSSKWEKIEISYEGQIPFYFGVVNINNELVLLLGGKFNAKEDNTNECYMFNCSNNVLEVERELKLPQKDEFDGKTFYPIGDNLFGMFSALYSDTFYIYNSIDKEFERIKYEDDNNHFEK